MTSPTLSYAYTRGCILSFDGTPIVYNLFEPLHPAPDSLYTILEGPGWGSAGATSPDPDLIGAGYAELTWDPRGFGQSGGVAEVDAPASEGMDVKALIDDVLTPLPETAKDQDPSLAPKTNQPPYTNDTPAGNSYSQAVVGMTGYSYGGGIEFAAASDDRAIKAIAPGWAWNDLDYSIFPGNVIKLGWDEILYGGGLAEQGATHTQGNLGGAPTLGGTGGPQVGGYDPMIHYAETTGTALGYPDLTTRSWFHQRSMAEYGLSSHPIQIPTLLVQGTTDTLFNLNDAWANEVEIARTSLGVPVKMIAYCDGHDGCPGKSALGNGGYANTAPSSSPVAPDESADAFAENRTIAWFDYYLRGQGSSDGMPAPVVYQTQDGSFRGTSTFPTHEADSSAYFSTTITPSTLVSTGAPSEADANTNGLVPGSNVLVADGPSLPGPTTETVPVTLPSTSSGLIVGEPAVSVNVTVDGPGADLYFKLVDTTTNQVIDQQTAPIRLDNLDLADNAAKVNVPIEAETIALDLGGVAYDVGTDGLELQISTSSISYLNFRGPADVTINSGTLYVPTVAGP